MSTNADQAIGAAVRQIEQHLQQAEHQARFIAARIEKGEVDPNNRKSFDLLLTGALAAAPQIEAAMLIKPDLHDLAVGRDRERDQIASTISTIPLTRSCAPAWRRSARARVGARLYGARSLKKPT
ncbi:MAG: hypothetical protein VCD31_15610 [Alphaproteobacteria bacterium]